MRKRQDLIYYVIYETIWPEKDLITIDIPVSVDHPIVFCLALRKKVKALTEKYLDLAKLTGTFDLKSIPSTFAALGESADILDALIDNNVARKLQNLSSLIVSLHYTDQKMFSEQTGHIRAVFHAAKKN